MSAGRRVVDADARRVLDVWRRIDWDGWWGDFLDVRFELARRLSRLRGECVLDVGCGHGVLLARVDHGCRRAGVDESMERLQWARRLCPGAWLVRADMAHLPFRAASFDAVVLGNVLELFPDRHVLLEGVRRVARDGALVLATTPNRDHLAYRGHPRLLDLGAVAASFAGFARLAVEGYNPLPSLVWYLPSRLKRGIPRHWYRYLFVPSPLMARLPGIRGLLRGLMRYRRLWPGCKAFLVTARVAGKP